MRILIMGCGRVGSGLAEQLAEQHHEVTVIEVDTFAFQRLLPEFDGRRLQGNGTDDRVLLEAGVEHADVFIAVASGDNRNILASQKAKEIYGVKTVVTRVKDPLRAELFSRLGLRTFSPTSAGIALAKRVMEHDDGSGPPHAAGVPDGTAIPDGIVTDRDGDGA